MRIRLNKDHAYTIGVILAISLYVVLWKTLSAMMYVGHQILAIIFVLGFFYAFIYVCVLAIRSEWEDEWKDVWKNIRQLSSKDKK